MGFRAEKLKLNRKIGKIKTILLLIFVAVFTAFILFSCFCPPESWKYHVAKPDVQQRGDGELLIDFIDVGQGDATLIRFPDGKTALIDGGNSTTESQLSLMRYLNGAGIDFIDCLVLTHTDVDHSGGLAEVVKYKEIGKAYLPLVDDYNVNASFAKLYAELQKKGVEIDVADKSLALCSSNPLYPYTLTCLYPYNDMEISEQSNENSCVLWLDYMGVSTIFCADAPASVERLILRDYKMNFIDVDLESTEIIKLPHHGSADGASAEFLELLGVKTAIVSVGKNNPYGHPSSEVLNRLNGYGVQTYRTDELGHITAVIHQNGEYEMIIENR